MLFDHIGIHGWGDIEPLILSAVLSDLSILFIGDVGSNKTEGSRIIAKTLLHQDIEFRNYEVPTLNFDDLIGFVNPKHLSKGTLEFVPTPLSIWNADAVLFDEINRANPFIQSKLHELIRTRTLMGLSTSLKIVFSAVNPPEKYQSGYMDMALASRFACIQVPGIDVMKEAEVDKIISNNGHHCKPYDLKAILAKARRCELKEEEQDKIYQMCKRVMRELVNQEILFNARQLKMMSRLIKSSLLLGYASGLSLFSEADTVTACITSVIPELHGIVRTHADAGIIKGSIRSIVSGFKLRDPVTISQNIKELCRVNITDSLAWVTAMKQMADTEEDIDALIQAADRVKTLLGKEVIEKELAHNLLDHITAQITIQTLLKEDAPVSRLLCRANEIAASV